MSEHALALLAEIRRRLRAARRRVLLAELAFGAAVTLGVLTALLGAAAFVEARWWLGGPARWAFVVLFGLVGLALVVLLLGRPLLRGLGILPGLEDHALARRAGEQFPTLADRLTTLLDLAEGRSSPTPDPLREAAVLSLGRSVADVPFERLADPRPARRAAAWSALPAAALVLGLLLAPSHLGAALERLFTPAVAYDAPPSFALSVEPGDTRLARGEALGIVARAEGLGLPRFATLELQREGELAPESVRLLPEEPGVYRYTEEDVRTGLRYRIVADGVASRWYRVQVLARPDLRGLRLTVVPPAYTGLPPQPLPEGVGDFSALPGSTVMLSARTTEPPPAEARVAFEHREPIPLTVRGREVSGRFVVRGNDRYRIALQSAEGLGNTDPIAYEIRTLPDAAPRIVLLEPTTDDLDDGLRVRVAARVADDYGFGGAALHYRLLPREGTPVPDARGTIALPVAPRPLEQDVELTWDLRTTGLELRPGDAVAFHLEVWDNNIVSGPQRARTPERLLRLASVRERIERLDAAEDAARARLDDARREAEDARRRFDDLRNRLRRQESPSWEERRQLERLRQQHERLDETLRESTRDLRELIDRLRERDLVSEETRQLYRELRRAVEEIADPDLAEQLRQLQEALEQLNLPRSLQTLERFAADEAQFRERLERALALMERLRTARELETAARRAEDIAAQEADLAEQTESLQQSGAETTPSERAAHQQRLAEQQAEAREATEALRERLERIAEDMATLRRPTEGARQELERMQRELRDAAARMQSNAQDLREGRLERAGREQRRLEGQLQRLQQRLEELARELAGQRQRANLAGLRRTLADVLTLSHEQEALRERTVRQRPESPVLRPAAQQQVELAAGLATVADSLRALAREIPQLQRAVQDRVHEAGREMREATERLADRQPPLAAAHQKGAMTALNDLALMLTQLLQQLAGGDAGDEGIPMQQLLQMLQQMGGDQQQLNREIQDHLNRIQGERLRADERQRLEQLQEQQRLLRERLDDLLRRGDLDGQGRSALQRVAEQMEEALRRLADDPRDPELPALQEDIHTRLLDAYRSIRQRHQAPEREGRPPGDTPPGTAPQEWLPPEAADRLRRELIRALESGYAPDYQELIRRYFDLLERRTPIP